MGLFVSDWLTGEEEFCNICYNYWLPHLTMHIVEQDKGILGFGFLDKQGESLLFSSVPEDSRKEFFNRYGLAVSYIAKRLNLDNYVQKLLSDFAPNGEITKANFEKMNKEFFHELIDYDWKNVDPLFERLSSLIFFDSWELIKHYKFIVYPEGGFEDE